MNDKPEKIALFRYGLIAPLILETLPRGELTRRAEEIASRAYDIPHSTRRTVSIDTLLDWALRYRRHGLEGLTPQPRQDRGQARVVNAQTAALIERLKRENPHRTGTSLLRQLASSQGQEQPTLSASTLNRFLRQHGLTTHQLLSEPSTARKKFEAQFANQIWQSDMLFGPWVERPGGGKRQVYLQATLDDASRLIPHAQFYPDQGLDSFLDCLRHAIAARGVPVRLYMDNAKIYRSPQLARIAASIGILIVHTPPYQPEGRGKIERYFRSVREQFLADLDRKALLTLEQLNERLGQWIDGYHRTEHSALQTTPLLRWQRDIEQIRQLPPATDLRRLFFHRVDHEFRVSGYLRGSDYDHTALCQSVVIDVREWRSRLEQLLTNTNLRKEMASYSREHAVAKYSRRVVAKQYEELWKESIDQCRSDGLSNDPDPCGFQSTAYFRCFGHYSHHSVTPEMLVRTAATSAARWLQERKNALGFINANGTRLVDVNICNEILTELTKSDNITLDALQKQCHREHPPGLWLRHLMWLAKHGYIEID